MSVGEGRSIRERCIDFIGHGVLFWSIPNANVVQISLQLFFKSPVLWTQYTLCFSLFWGVRKRSLVSSTANVLHILAVECCWHVYIYIIINIWYTFILFSSDPLQCIDTLPNRFRVSYKSQQDKAWWFYVSDDFKSGMRRYAMWVCPCSLNASII